MDLCIAHLIFLINLIKFNLNGTNFFGYLTQDGIIRHNSKIIPCSDSKALQTPNGTLINRVNGQVKILDIRRFKFNFYHVVDKPSDLFFHDCKELVYLNGHAS
jgi:hypothetical protein